MYLKAIGLMLRILSIWSLLFVLFPLFLLFPLVQNRTRQKKRASRVVSDNIQQGKPLTVNH